MSPLPPDLKDRLDHLVFGVPDLERGIALLEDLQHDRVPLVLDAEEEGLPRLEEHVGLGRDPVLPHRDQDRPVPGGLQHLAGEDAPVP